MAEIKTRPNRKSVNKFLKSIKNKKRKEDSYVLLDLFERVTKRNAVMWGDSIVGFGRYEYTNTKGTYSWLMTGFSPRKQNSTIYVLQDFEDFEEDLQLIGNVKTAKSCLYITSLSKIDLNQLERFIANVVTDMEEKFTCK